MSFAPRQIHLDFHTSNLIGDVGKEFVPDEFIDTLKKAKVTSVTCFARCHHGMLYYPSEIHSSAIHPSLKCDLLGEQLKACKKHGIKAPVYMPIQWDQFIAENHPEWCMRNKQGGEIVASWSKPGYFEDGFYTFLCVNSGYRDYIFEEVAELQDKYDIDGFFFDIVYPKACYSLNCIKQMQQQGIDIEDEKQVLAFYVNVLAEFKHELSQRVWAKNPNATIYYNTSHIHPGYRQFLGAISHVEVESLPSGGWGYDHFPVVGRYARTLGKNVMGMTGKFHTYWGDFHSLKNQEALEYECFLTNAMGAYVSVGDQMHPDGKLSQAGYQLIGNVFSQLEEVADYSHNIKSVTEIAILNPEENKKDADLNVGNALIGATRLLQECAFQFDIIDSYSDFEQYKLIVLVDSYNLNSKISAKLNRYIQNGGKILASGVSPFDKTLQQNWLNNFPVIPQGEIPFSPDYLQICNDYSIDLPTEELVMYQGGIKVQAVKNSQIFANTIAPYFNRKGREFCSHQHTPSSRKVSHPALVSNQQISYFSNPVFSIYAQKAPRWIRTLVENQCLMLLEQNRLVSHNAPRSLIALLNHQIDKKRYVLHLLHYVPENKCKDLLIVDAKIPLHQIQFELQLAEIKKAYPVRKGSELNKLTLSENKVSFELDKLTGYQLICFEY
ncbi:hypothetical protein BMT54_04520 [Pasteurellaceae bacterium 15-036681]|nr:hypothetical protein BMT54_04520 [Pasteurellaceae bacterium 15-036681]